MRFNKLGALLLFSVFVLMPVCADGFLGIDADFGTTMVLDAEDVSVSPEPDPVSSVLGISVPFLFGDVFYFEPGLRVYSARVVVDETRMKPVPAAVETAGNITVLALDLRPETGVLFHLGDALEAGATACPSFLFKIPLYSSKHEADDMLSTVGSYYMSSGRFLYFYAGGFMNWKFAENTFLKFKISTDLPVFHIWDGEDIAFYDQMKLTAELGLSFRF